MYDKEGNYVKPNGKTLAQIADEACNTFNTSTLKKDFIEAMGNVHPTLQQTFTSLCVAWLQHLTDEKAWVDGRNQASQDFAMSIKEQLNNARFPMI